MKIEFAQRSCLLLHDDGRIHYPMSKFLSEKFDNPHTRELVGQSLRVFYRFMSAHRIELAVRAVEGRCLTYQECVDLAGLSYRPLNEIELLSDSKVVLIASAKAKRAPRDLPKAVEPNTVKKRLSHIAAYLAFYREAILDGHIRSNALRAELMESYRTSCDELDGQIGGTKQSHHLSIQSLPRERFLAIIRTVFKEPERLFRTDSGKVSSTLYRDRAMTLLACECLRPGAIANVAREDFHAMGNYLNVKDHRGQRVGRTTAGTPVLKLGQSTRVNSASETMIQLFPFTVEAISDYMQRERATILRKHLRNRSRGFLFLNQDGEPIGHRSTVTRMFNRLGRRLNEVGMLDVGNDPHFRNHRQYDFYGYVLRHSAASLFLDMKGTSDRVLDEMRHRFGWTRNSTMPQLYAARTLSDAADIKLMEFHTAMSERMTTGEA